MEVAVVVPGGGMEVRDEGVNEGQTPRFII
jgi:hypothetical protein